MSVIARREDQNVYVFEGWEHELRAHLARKVATGQLTEDGVLRGGRYADGRLWVRVHLLPARPVRRVRRSVVVTGVVAAAVVLGVVGWLVVVAVSWLLALVVAHIWQIVAVLVVVLGGVWALGQVGACPGLHCPGCKHR